MSYIKRMVEEEFEGRIDEFSDERLSEMGYSENAIEMLRECFGEE